MFHCFSLFFRFKHIEINYFQFKIELLHLLNENKVPVLLRVYIFQVRLKSTSEVLLIDS